MKDSRRDFLKKGALAGFGALMIPELAKAVVKETTAVHAPKIQLKKESVILFQGDSITDCGRKRDNNQCNNFDQLGSGYALFTATQLLKDHADKQLKIYNRGVSGNKVFQLRERWELEALAFQPEVLSILIGVNDYWHTLSGGYKGTVEVYESDLRSLLTYTKEKLPNVQLVLGEPFAIRGGSAIDEPKWFPMFDEYKVSLKKLATEFNAVFVPYQSAFDAAVKLAPARYWSADGVHPDLPGRQLMADLWLEATGLKK
ncbi:SGNH/GDSL hydrolase family protein [Parabacteroides sp. Marseille-P3160]|uniref:SGNH/GDSL hydrolase family protein n=1 Tax=Parabacteroides sp. Marseille-P3160 TaxID=1917887 RepID=UPI0009BA0DA0|nr:SGNH/GDSL hydrolase family protein [Parabacteroides sp. Marseille-P3160]